MTPYTSSMDCSVCHKPTQKVGIVNCPSKHISCISCAFQIFQKMKACAICKEPVNAWEMRTVTQILDSAFSGLSIKK